MKNAKPDLTGKIQSFYNTPNPDIAYCVGGLRRLSVDPNDARARKMLLSKGPRHTTRQQRFIYNCLSLSDFDLFVDVGVNYGECLLSVPLYCSTKILGFEANPKLIPFIEKSLRYNDDIRNISVQNKAVSDRSLDAIEFHIDTLWSGTSSVIKNRNDNRYEQVTVACTTIDVELAKLPPAKNLLMKIDVEGHEPFVLKGSERSLATVERYVILMEYDEIFVSRSGAATLTFIDGIFEKHRVYELLSDSIIRVHAPADLQTKDKRNNIHTDIILIKSNEPDFYTSFDHMFVNKQRNANESVA